MNFECGGFVRSPGVFATFDTFKKFRSWACREFRLLPLEFIDSVSVKYFDARRRVWQDADVSTPFILAPGYAIVISGQSPVTIRLVSGKK